MNAACYGRISNGPLLGLDVSIHTGILFSLLTALFMFLVSKDVKQLVEGQLKDIASNATKSALLSSGWLPMSKLAPLLNTGAYQGMLDATAQPDPIVVNNNKWAFRSMEMTGVALAVVAIAIILSIRYTSENCIGLKELMMMDLAVFGGVGIIEYLFFTNIALKYIPAAPSDLSRAFVTALQQDLQK